MRRNDFADLILDRLEDELGGFDAGRRRDPKVKLDLPAIDLGEKVAADDCQHHAAERKHQRGGHRDNDPSLEQHRERPDVTSAKAPEAALEAGMKACEPAVNALAMAFALQQRPMTIGVNVRDST